MEKQYFSTSQDKKEFILARLIRFRSSNYADLSIILDSDIDTLKSIAFDNATKLLSLNMRPSTELDETLSKCLELLIAEFRPQNKRRAAIFCDQLNQYMTLRCSNEPISSFSLSELEFFLESNQKKLGPTSQNLFILEYKLTKLYNEMMHLNRAARGVVAPLQNFESCFRSLGEANTRLRNLTDQLSRNNPNSIFIHYLSLAASYIQALAIETLSERLQTNSDEPVPTQDLKNLQVAYLQKAISSLDKITDLITEYRSCERIKPDIEGLAFSLNQNVLRNFVIDNIEELNAHLHSKISP